MSIEGLLDKELSHGYKKLEHQHSSLQAGQFHWVRNGNNIHESSDTKSTSVPVQTMYADQDLDHWANGI